MAKKVIEQAQNETEVKNEEKAVVVEQEVKADKSDKKAKSKEDKSAKNSKSAKKSAKKEKKGLGKKLKESMSELKKVSWPTFGKTVKQTGMVIGVVFVCTLVLFGIESLFYWLYGLLF